MGNGFIDVMMGVQFLTEEQAEVAEAHLKQEVRRLQKVYNVEDWEPCVVCDRTPVDQVRAVLATLLSEDTPDDEVSDHAIYVLPKEATGWGPEQLQGDLMDAILKARAYAQASTTETVQ